VRPCVLGWGTEELLLVFLFVWSQGVDACACGFSGEADGGGGGFSNDFNGGADEGTWREEASEDEGDETCHASILIDRSA